jgi:CRP-like cAMP-binding protein
MDQSSLIDRLRGIPYFNGLDNASLQKLAELATWHEYAPGAIIFRESEANSGLLGIQTGWMKLVKYSGDGREQVLRYLGPGDAFNEIAMFLSRPNPATAIALEQVVLWQLHRTIIQPLMVAHPELLLQVMVGMADRIAYLAELVADLSFLTVEVRLARLLLDAAPDDALVRQVWLTQAEMAARLGTVPDVLNRALRTLSDAGLIRVDRRQITILDRGRLRQRAQLTA